ncbi:MAG: TonB-dependent receptor, partial [Calditrichia bacterium]|nr:TonB-dependent receptor [Calditrichia bacterium]
MWKKLLPIIMLLMCFTQLWAQNGKLVGVISDKSSGDPLVGVNVLIEGTVVGASTDGDGYYVIVGLQPGTYNVNVSYIGYQPVTIKGVLIKSDLTTTINAEMGEDQLRLEETIVVIAERPIIQRDLTSSKTITTEDEIELLPVDNVTDIVNLTPGFVDGHARGGRDGEIVYKIDGVDAQDPATGGYDTQVPDFALQEISVETGGVGAEFGNAQSGVINMTIAEGGQDYSGRIRYTTSDFDFVKDSWSDYHRQKKMEFSIGGPELISHLLSGQRNKLRLMLSGSFDKDHGRMEHYYDHDYSVIGKLMYRMNDNNKFTFTFTYKEGESGGWLPQWKKHVQEEADLNGNGVLDT